MVWARPKILLPAEVARIAIVTVRLDWSRDFTLPSISDRGGFVRRHEAGLNAVGGTVVQPTSPAIRSLNESGSLSPDTPAYFHQSPRVSLTTRRGKLVPTRTSAKRRWARRELRGRRWPTNVTVGGGWVAPRSR